MSTEKLTIDNVTTTFNQIASRTNVFEALVIMIGSVGLLANATVLFVIIKSKQENNRAFNELLMNQMVLDLFSCLWLVIAYSIMIYENIQQVFRYWSCILFRNENLLWWGFYGSKVNLMNISIERYVMIVHPIWHRYNAKPWMIHAAVGVSWFMGFTFSVPASFASTTFVDGMCNISEQWVTVAAESI